MSRGDRLRSSATPEHPSGIWFAKSSRFGKCWASIPGFLPGAEPDQLVGAELTTSRGDQLSFCSRSLSADLAFARQVSDFTSLYSSHDVEFLEVDSEANPDPRPASLVIVKAESHPRCSRIDCSSILSKNAARLNLYTCESVTYILIGARSHWLCLAHAQACDLVGLSHSASILRLAAV